MDREELDESRLTLVSQNFSTCLFSRYPEFKQYAAMERIPPSEEWSLIVTVPAASGDSAAGLFLWLDEGNEPSVAFGGWHTHECCLDNYEKGDHEEFLNFLTGILCDQFILCEDVGGVGDGSIRLLDQADQDALLEELTCKYSPGRVRLRSWSGRFDRLVDIEDLDQEGLA